MYTVIYDGECRFCRRFAAALARWDRRGRFETIAYQDPAATRRFPAIPLRDMRAALQLVTAAGARYEGAAALERIITDLPAGSWLSWVFRLPFLGRVLDRGYRWFARNRFWFGCGAHCRSR